MDIAQSYSSPPTNYSSSKHRTHGLSVIPSFPQIMSYLLIIGEIIVYFKCIFPNYSSYSMLGLYSAFGIIMILAAFLSTIHNPTDRIVYYYKWSQKDIKIKFKCNFKELKYCNFCDSHCSNTSKHCKQCNRCVPQFDHHCIWFNNCVGKSNYKPFFISIVFTFLHLLLFVIHGIVMSIQVRFYIQMKLLDLIVVWVFLVILVIFQFLLINLIALHIYLTYIGKTTYQFLKQTKIQAQKRQIIKKQTQNMIEICDVIQKQESIANIATIIRVSSQDTAATTQFPEMSRCQTHEIQQKRDALNLPLSRQKIIQQKYQDENQDKNKDNLKQSEQSQQTKKQQFQAPHYQIEINHVLNIEPQIKSQNQQDLEPSQKTVKIRNRCRTIITYTNNDQDLENSQNPNKKSNYSSYFKNNRSFKFILNGDSPRAQSPRKQRGFHQKFTTTKKKDKNNQIQLFSFEQPTREQPRDNINN